MKYLLKTLAITSCFFLLFSCGDDKTTNKQTIQETEKAVKETSNANATLVSETPLSKEQFESWLPETLLGLPQRSATINRLQDIGSCSATYSEKNTRIRVMVIDAAGEKGADATATYRMSSTRDYDEKGSWGYTKTKTINGIKVKESFLKDEKYNLSIFYNNRFAVDIETHEIGEEKLGQLLKELQLEQLH
jgi:hypothetical protein